MKHTSQVKGFCGSNVDLAEQIGDLYYDSLSDLLVLLAEKIESDSKADAERGRPKLAEHLQRCASSLFEASKEAGSAWDICTPHVDKWLETHGKCRK